ncbi:hypothetical protein [Nocardioides hungaricus]
MERRIVLVTGAGSGTVAGALHALGMRAPDPEWVARLHADLLDRCDVALDDGRPAAWLEAGKVAVLDGPRERLETWLRRQLEDAPELVVADPGLPWLLGLWRWAALRCGASLLHVVVVGAEPESGDGIERTAARVNAMLHTERSTRGHERRLVRYAELRADWTVPLAALDLDVVRSATAQDQRAVHDFLATDPPIATVPWDELRVPARLREIAAAAARHLVEEDHAALDQLRAAYLDLYEEAESIAQSSVVAVRNRRRKSHR